MAKKEMVTIAEAELYLKAFADDMLRTKEKLLRIEFQIPGFTEEQRQIVAQIIRQSMIELAKERLPAKFRKRLPPQLAKRADELFKLWAPEEQ